jgi:hypothetical protein
MKASRELETTTRKARRPWQRPTLTPAGTIGSVLRGGSNKVTVVTGDPGEPRKIPGMDK